jgi:GNAT superfamily N-acetyltransferase
MIYVLPEYQRLGIGSAIWREIEKLLEPNRKNNRAGGYLQYSCYRVLQAVWLSRYRKAMGEKKFGLRSGTAIPAMEMLAKQEQE